MFGYVIPRKPELKVKDYNLYKAVYCTLCKTLNDDFGMTARVLVNYDFVFLSLLGMGLKGEQPVFSEGRCNTNPLKKQVFVLDDGIIRYSAGCLVISSYYKLSDDVADEHGMKKVRAFFARMFLRRPYKRAAKELPAVDALVKMSMEIQKKAEREKATSYDATSDASAVALSHIFEKLGDGEGERRVLARLGYLVGRFVYLADAGDDLAEDLKENRYNPAAIRYELTAADAKSAEKLDPVREKLKEELFLTRGEIANSYNLLDIRQFKDILDNIVFLGLEDTIFAIGCEKKGTMFNDRSV